MEEKENISWRYLIDRRDYEEALPLLLKAVDKNDYDAMLQLAELYERGLGVDYDDEEASRLRLLAAQGFIKEADENNNPHAQYMSAICIDQGYLPNIKDKVKKYEYYLLKAAENNDVDAQFTIADLYFSGGPYKRDVIKAVYWFDSAAINGNAEASYILGGIYEDGVEDIKCDIKKALLYYEKAFDLGFTLAAYSLGNIYLEGKKIDKNIEESSYWFNRGAEEGDIYCKMHLEQLDTNPEVYERKK